MRRGRRGHSQERIATVAIALVCAILLVIAAAERGLFSKLSVGANVVAIPGVTLDDDDDGHGGGAMPVVTSLRSDSEAERLGIRVGDHIAAVDDHPVRNVATLRAAIRADDRQSPVALHIVRGSALWTVAIDRAEPPADAGSARAKESPSGHGAQDPAG